MSEKLPKGWTKLSLEEIATVERGKFTPRPRNNPVYYGGSIPFVQTGDIANSGTYLTDYSQTLNEEGRNVSRVFPKNTILITIAANIGKTAITAFDTACPDSIVGIQADDSCTDIFWLNSYLELIQNNVEGLATQNAQKNINLQLLKPLLFNVPPLIEQQKITRILTTWDAAITCAQTLLDNSRQQKKALMQQLLTGRRRLSGFHSAWGMCALSQLAHIEKGKALNGDQVVPGQFPVIAGGQKSPYSHNVFTHQNAITISASGAYAGFIAYHKEKFWGSDCSIIQSKPGVDILFLFFSLLINQKSIYLLQRGGAQPHVYPNDIAQLTIPAPPLDEQKAIAKVLSAADALIAQYEARLAHLQKQKKTLMQQLLTGKIRVTPDTPDAMPDTSGDACETPA